MGRYFLHRLHPLSAGELLDAAAHDVDGARDGQHDPTLQGHPYLQREVRAFRDHDSDHVAGSDAVVVPRGSLLRLARRILAGGRKRMTKAMALHQATHQVRQKREEWEHPYYWAPFVLVGDSV